MLAHGYYMTAPSQYQYQYQPKEERYDEAEINDLANKIREANQLSLAAAAGGQGYPYNPLVTGAPLAFARPGQPTIQQFFAPPASETGAMATTAPAPPSKPSDSDKPLDEESKKGKFGWFDIEKVYLPYILRYGSEKYTSVRMVERRLLNRYLQVLPPEVSSCTCIRSYYITDAESKLLNEINLKHSDCSYGKEAFTSKDLVVRLKDAKEFHKFLELCHKKLVLKRSNASDRCGFFRINGESVVPYTVKEGVKYVPFLFRR